MTVHVCSVNLLFRESGLAHVAREREAFIGYIRSDATGLVDFSTSHHTERCVPSSVVNENTSFLFNLKCTRVRIINVGILYFPVLCPMYFLHPYVLYFNVDT